MTQTTVPWASSQDGQRLTVNMMVKQPAVVQRRILKMMDQQFLADALLRTGPPAPGGAVVVHESDPLYAEGGDAPIVEEFGEIPSAHGRRGIPSVVRTVKRALALDFSEEMRRRNDVGEVDRQLDQIRNTMRRTWENVFLAGLLTNSRVNTLAAGGLWSSSTTRIRDDLAEAVLIVQESDADTVNGTGDSKFEFDPDTLVISNRTAADFIKSDDINKIFLNSPLVGQSLQYKGKMPSQFFGLDVVKSRRLPPNMAIVLERKTVGGISDERPLQTGPMEREGRTETYFMNVIRQSALFIDQPKAACLITGIR